MRFELNWKTRKNSGKAKVAFADYDEVESIANKANDKATKGKPENTPMPIFWWVAAIKGPLVKITFDQWLELPVGERSQDHAELEWYQIAKAENNESEIQEER